MKGTVFTEVWDLYDENRNLTGKDHIRGEELPDGLYHTVVHIWIRNIKGLYLISQRSADRPRFPLMWECVGGSVLKGENSLHGALKEVKEEVGVDLDSDNGKIVLSMKRKTVNGEKFNDFTDVWLFEYDGEVSLEKATENEVAQVKWFSREQIKELYYKKQFVPTLNYFFERADIF